MVTKSRGKTVCMYIISIPQPFFERIFSASTAFLSCGPNATKVRSLPSEIFIAFPIEKTGYFPAKKILSVGNPIRKEILNGSKKEAKKIFGLTGEKPIILILGGSQGAQRINDTLLIILSDILEKFEIIHQTGQANFEQVKKEAEVVMADDLKNYYHPTPFLNEAELAVAFQAADLIISRAGAGTIFEIAAVGKPSILVPLFEAAQNHQVKNAYAFAESGAALVIEEANFKPHFLLERLKYIFSWPERLKQMEKKAKDFSRPEAATVIVNYIIEYLS